MVTGAAGLIGSHLTRALLELGHEVVAVDDLSQGREANLEGCRDHAAFRFHRADILDRPQMQRLAEGVATIAHLAALKIPRYDGYLGTLEVGARGTEAVLECARPGKARVLFASTDDVYGKNPDPVFSEESALVLGDSRVNRWASAVSKVYGEHLCFAYADSHGVPVSIVRYSGVYGPTTSSRLSGPRTSSSTPPSLTSRCRSTATGRRRGPSPTSPTPWRRRCGSWTRRMRRARSSTSGPPTT
jgi:UDP-glucose 4-epimerase